MNFVLIHGMSAPLDESFGIKVKQRLVNHGFGIIEPLFPLEHEITLDKWLEVMDKIKVEDNQNYLCHSLGCNFIIKYLFHKKLKADTIIAVAGGYFNESQVWPGFSPIKDFIPTEEELDYFRKNTKAVYLIYSNNDHIYTQSYFDAYMEKTGAKGVFVKDQGHFGRSSKVKDIPIIETLL